MKTYFQMTQVDDEVNLNIYGDITSYPFTEQETSAFNLSRQLEQVSASKINVYINSYGGEVAEGLAIYNALKRQKAKIVTYVDGFACSIASVIFMAGDERVMNKASLLMIHNAWTVASGNSEELRKLADDLEKITSASVEAYLENVTISKKKLCEMMDEETWISPAEAVKMGFATSIFEEASKNPSQSVKEKMIAILQSVKKEDLEEEVEEDPEENPEENPEDDPETDENEEKTAEKAEKMMKTFLYSLMKGRKTND